MNIVSLVLGVFGEIGEWFVSFMPTIISMFYTTAEGGVGQLTFLGVLAIISLGISVVFLFMRLIENFLHLRA